MTRPSIDELVAIATEAGWPDEPSKVWPEDVENAINAVLAAIDLARFGPPPVKRTDVPTSWLDDPEAWWRHVDACRDCSRYHERPKAEAQIARLEQEGEWE